MRKAAGLLLALAMLLAIVPAGAGSSDTRGISGSTLIDTDGSDGYSGDYVLIFNPSTMIDNVKNTGDMSELIEHEVEPYEWKERDDTHVRCPMGDADAFLAKEAKAKGEYSPTKASKAPLEFEVGDTHVFYITWYSPTGNPNILFKVLAKGEHCYVWTPVSDDPNVWPLDGLDPDYAQIAADVFDSKFDLMLESFGEHDNGELGDGRLNLMFYNIDEGWEYQNPITYFGGYFYSYDYYYNEMPMLNIDTYPTIHYVYEDGTVYEDIALIYNVMVHEYQHLINYSNCGFTDDMINETMSAAAEEICFPGSSVVGRLLSWTNYYEMGGYDLLDPPVEVEYIPEYPVENGYSLFRWDYLPVDTLVLYAQGSLFAQYLYTHFGNTVFHAITDELADGCSTVAAIENATERDASMLAEEFRVAVTANTGQDEYGGKYGFKVQEGYDPDEYYGVENPYDLLCPVVFTGDSCEISGGGAICVKPVGGVYYPPHGASSGLIYYGITRNATPPEPIEGDVDLDGFVTANDALLTLRYSLGLTALTDAQLAEADVDGSGVIDANDALTILRKSLGLVS